MKGEKKEKEREKRWAKDHGLVFWDCIEHLQEAGRKRKKGGGRTPAG